MKQAPHLLGAVVAPVSKLRPQQDLVSRGLRIQLGIASLAIVVFNVFQFCNVGAGLAHGALYTAVSSLDASVPWMFVIVGYLFYRPFVDAIRSGRHSVAVSTLAKGAALRLLPIYGLAVTVIWFSRQPTLPGDWQDLLEHLSFTQVFDGNRIFFTDGPAWAISVAVLVCGFLLIAAHFTSYTRPRESTSTSRSMRLWLPCVVLAGVSLGWKAYAAEVLGRPVYGSYPTWFGPVANLDNLAVGMAVAVAAASLRDSGRFINRSRLLLGGTAAVILVVAFTLRTMGSWSEVYFSSACAVAFGAVVLLAVVPERGVRAGVPPLRSAGVPATALAWVGSLVFGTYLLHEPVMLALQGHLDVRADPAYFGWDLIVVLSATILAAWVSYTLIERPIFRLPQILARRPN